jgi:predicted dehydrogenase
MHAEWTIKAAERGKHVLCEKPLAMNVREAEAMAAACREHGVQLMDGVMWLHHPRARDMLRPIQDGTLGRLRRVTSAFTFCWDEIPHADFRLRRESGGGSLYDLGWYSVGAALWAFGALPERVYGTARYYNDIDMSFSGLLWFADERMSSFDSGFDTGMRKWLEVAGTAGSLVCDDFTRAWNEDRPRFWLHGPQGKTAEHVSASPSQEVCLIEDFCAIVRSGRLNDHWPQIAVATQRMCDALDRSARTGEAVELRL